jgi:hypothetical protein
MKKTPKGMVRIEDLMAACKANERMSQAVTDWNFGLPNAKEDLERAARDWLNALRKMFNKKIALKFLRLLRAQVGGDEPKVAKIQAELNTIIK